MYLQHLHFKTVHNIAFCQSDENMISFILPIDIIPTVLQIIEQKANVVPLHSVICFT